MAKYVMISKLSPEKWTVVWEKFYRHPRRMDSKNFGIPHTLDSEKTGKV